MADIREFNLLKIPGNDNVKFVKAEVLRGRATSFAIVRIEDKRITPQYKLRLDLDKGVFLDRFEDRERNILIQNAAPEIVKLIVSQLKTKNKTQSLWGVSHNRAKKSTTLPTNNIRGNASSTQKAKQARGARFKRIVRSPDHSFGI